MHYTLHLKATVGAMYMAFKKKTLRTKVNETKKSRTRERERERGGGGTRD